MRGGNQRAVGASPKAEAISVMECATVNDVTSTISGRSARKGITRQRMKSRWSVPSRIEPDETWISVQLERTRSAGGREKLKRGHDPQSESREPRLDGEGGAIRGYRVLEQRIEQLLVPVQLHGLRQPRARNVRQGLVVR